MLRSKGYWRPGMTVRLVVVNSFVVNSWFVRRIPFDRADERRYSFPTNDVFHEYNHCYVRYEFADAVKELRYCFDPSLLDRPDDFITAKIEFDVTIGKTQQVSFRV
jgi:hypothetical protein